MFKYTTFSSSGHINVYYFSSFILTHILDLRSHPSSLIFFPILHPLFFFLYPWFLILDPWSLILIPSSFTRSSFYIISSSVFKLHSFFSILDIPASFARGFIKINLFLLLTVHIYYSLHWWLFTNLDLNLLIYLPFLSRLFSLLKIRSFFWRHFSKSKIV